MPKANWIKSKNNIELLKEFNPGNSVLIVSPHPDDEWLSFAGTLHRCHLKNPQFNLRILMMTGGGNFPKLEKKWLKKNNTNFLDIRPEEAKNFLKNLGRSPDEIINMHLEDGSVSDMIIRHIDNHLEMCVDKFVEQLQNNLPKTIIMPHFFDEHGDHWGAAIITLLSLLVYRKLFKQDENEMKLLMYVTHYGDYPFFIPSRKLKNNPPFNDDGEWKSILLNVEDYKFKKRSLRFYQTQTFDLLYSIYMKSFLKKNELFEEYSFGKPYALTNSTKINPDQEETNEIILIYNTETRHITYFGPEIKYRTIDSNLEVGIAISVHNHAGKNIVTKLEVISDSYNQPSL